MIPTFAGFDHVHVYVTRWQDAEKWYSDVLGLKRVEALMVWAVKGGPLTMEDATGKIHLALFESEDHSGSTAVAFGATGQEFLKWKTHLDSCGLDLRITDHKLAYSLYFHDPDNNMYEITTYEHGLVRAALVKVS